MYKKTCKTTKLIDFKKTLKVKSIKTKVSSDVMKLL